MSAPATPFPATIDDADERHAVWAQGVIERQVARLELLADAGTELALSIKAQATEETRDACVKAFNRVARSVRLAGLLQTRLLQDLQRMRSWDQTQVASARAAAETKAAEQKAMQDPAYGHKARVEAVVARVAKADTDDQDKVERLIAECGERLDDDDIYGDVLTRPVGELVALICRDLDLRPDWPRLAEEAWAQEEIRSEAPNSPFAKYMTHTRPPPAKRGRGPLKGVEGACGATDLCPNRPVGPLPPQAREDAFGGPS